MNMYAYVGGDPVNSNDSSGLCTAHNYTMNVFTARGENLGPDQKYPESWTVMVGCDVPFGGGANPNFGGDGVNGGADGATHYFAGAPKGERNRTAKASGTKKPFKKIKEHPTKPGWIEYPDQNGKTNKRPGIAEELSYLKSKRSRIADGGRVIIPFRVAVGMCMLAPAPCSLVDVNGDGQLDSEDWEEY
jgi:hypothetical protein